jgi:hypothetical protein
MLETEYVVKRVKSLPDESLMEVANFIEFLEVKRTRLVEKEEKKEKSDLFAKAIGICEGPSDLAEGHDKYVYG